MSVCSGKALALLEIMNESQEFSMRVSEAELETSCRYLLGEEKGALRMMFEFIVSKKG